MPCYEIRGRSSRLWCSPCAVGPRGRRFRCVELEEIAKNDYNLNISRYISTAVADKEIDLGAVNAELVSLEQKIEAATEKHNAFLKELGLLPLP